MAKIVFFGTPKHVICVPEALKNCGHKVIAVVTQPAKPVGRKQLITASPVALWARKNNVKILDGNLQDIIGELQKLKADLGVLEAYGRIVPQEILDAFPRGIINVHPSLLPKYRGSSPVQATILNGDKTTGITLIKLDTEMDHGSILYQEEAQIKDNDTLDSLQERLFVRSAQILCDLIPKYLSGRVRPYQQNEAEATYTWNTNETKEKAYFDINNPPAPGIIERMARAFYPWPNAWTKWSLFAGASGDKNGKIVKFLPGRKIQLEGKKVVDYKQFKEGYPDFPLEI